MPVSAEISLQQSCEARAVSSFVLCHFMDSIVDRVEVGCLRALCKVELTGAGACLSFYAQLEILLGGVGQHLAQELGELRGMLSLFKGVLGERGGYLGISLAVGDASHREIHTDLRALALEV